MDNTSRLRKERNLRETAATAASMFLFLLFSVCSLVMIAVAASAYGRTGNNYKNTFNSAATVRYISNKLRAAESSELVSDRSILISFSDYSALIYEDNGIVYERIASAGEIPLTQGGERLFEVQGFSVAEEEGLIKVTAISDGENTFTVYCRKGMNE